MRDKVTIPLTREITRKKDMQNVQKVEEFEAFLKILELRKIESWESVAEALGVHRNTIEKWRQHPLAQKARAKGIENALEQMEASGQEDWKMWREKLRLLGVKEETPRETTVNVGVYNMIREKYGEF